MKLLITAGIRLLQVLFFAGWIGSLLVILLTLYDYIRTDLAKDKDEGGPQPSSTVIQGSSGQ